MQTFSPLSICLGLLLLLPVSARSELQYFVGYLDVVNSSGKACDGMRGRHQISLLFNNDTEQGQLIGYFGGDNVTVGQLSGSSHSSLKVRYPENDPARAEGHTLKVALSGDSLTGELKDRHLDASVDDCNFDLAKLAMKRSYDDESARLSYQKMSALFDAQLTKSSAILLARKGSYSEALPQYEKALSFAEKAFGTESPRLNSYLASLANSYIRVGRFADFNRLYSERYSSIKDEAVRLIFNEYRIRSLLQIGRSALSREEYSQALEQFRQALLINSKNKDVIAAIMSALVRSGQHDEAITFLEQTEASLDNDPDRRDVRGAIALVHYKKAKRDEKSGRVAEAEVAIRKAIQLDPDTAQYSIILARWRHKSGNYAEADSILKKAHERFTSEAARSEIAAAREKLKLTEMILTKIRRAGS
jgi:tetratricopeptide (TPR) repeat protein